MQNIKSNPWFYYRIKSQVRNITFGTGSSKRTCPCNTNPTFDRLACISGGSCWLYWGNLITLFLLNKKTCICKVDYAVKRAHYTTSSQELSSHCYDNSTLTHATYQWIINMNRNRNFCKGTWVSKVFADTKVDARPCWTIKKSNWFFSCVCNGKFAVFWVLFPTIDLYFY